MSNTSANQLNFWQILLKRRSVLFGLFVLVVMITFAIFAQWLTPHDPNALSVRNRLSPPSYEWWFGTDELGRDIFTRMVYAGRISLGVGFGVAVISTFFGVILGLAAGYFRKLDTVISRVIDAMMAFPDILLAIALVATLGSSMTNVIIALSIVYTPRIARTVRASTLVIREATFVEAAHAIGTKTWRIMIFHILFNIASPVVVQATFIFAYAMLAEAGLSFLGVGINPETPTWGTMINVSREYINSTPTMILFPALAISLAALALQLVGDGMRDALDPRLSKEM